MKYLKNELNISNISFFAGSNYTYDTTFLTDISYIELLVYIGFRFSEFLLVFLIERTLVRRVLLGLPKVKVAIFSQ